MSGRFAESLSSFQTAYQTYSKLNDALGQASTAQHAGDVLRQLERFGEALRWYTRAGHTPDALCGIAMAKRGQGHFAAALKIFKTSERRYVQTRDKVGIAYAFWAMGTTERFMGRFQDAETHLRKSLELYKALKDRSGTAFALAGLGGTLRMRGLAAESGRLYQKANRIFVSLQDHFGLAYTFCGQGNAWRMQGHLKQALSFMDKAIRCYERLGQKGPLGFVLWSRAQTNILMRRFLSAKKDLLRAHSLFRSVHDFRGELYCELGFGEFYRHQDSARAMPFYRRALKKARRHRLPFEALHAERHLFRRASLNKSYARCGVVSAAFQKYASLP